MFLEYESANENLIKYKCLSCNKNYSNNLFMNTFKFSNNDISNFLLLLRKGFYPYKFMDDSKKFNETSLLEKEEFYSNLNKENITDSDYNHPERICKDFEIKNLGEYYDLHVNFIQDGPFWGCLWMDGRGGGFSKKSHT